MKLFLNYYVIKMKFELNSVYDENIIQDEILEKKRQVIFQPIRNKEKKFENMENISYNLLKEYGYNIISIRGVGHKKYQSLYFVKPNSYKATLNIDRKLETQPASIDIYIDRQNQNRAKIYLVRKTSNFVEYSGDIVI